ncbi:MAG: hypothetical protein GY771_16700 [bacterium]|nr:hypothetical protein [bacterium]
MAKSIKEVAADITVAWLNKTSKSNPSIEDVEDFYHTIHKRMYLCEMDYPVIIPEGEILDGK